MKKIITICTFIIFSIQTFADLSSFHAFPQQNSQNYYNPNYSSINTIPPNINRNYNKAQKQRYKRYLREQQALNNQYYNQNRGFWQNVKDNFFSNGVVTGVSPIIPPDIYYHSPNYYDYYSY